MLLLFAFILSFFCRSFCHYSSSFLALQVLASRLIHPLDENQAFFSLLTCLSLLAFLDFLLPSSVAAPAFCCLFLLIITLANIIIIIA